MDQDVDPAAVVGDDRARSERSGRGGKGVCWSPPRASLSSTRFTAVAVDPRAFSSSVVCCSLSFILLNGRRRQGIARRQLLRAHVLVAHRNEAEAQQRQPGAAAPQRGDDAGAELVVAEEEGGEAGVGFRVRGTGRERRKRLSNRGRDVESNRRNRFRPFLSFFLLSFQPLFSSSSLGA